MSTYQNSYSPLISPLGKEKCQGTCNDDLSTEESVESFESDTSSTSTLSTKSLDGDLERRMLYSSYKELSQGVFVKLKQVYTKEELRQISERNEQCALKRKLYQERYVPENKIDHGHQKIIDAALLKARACSIASLPEETIRGYGETMRQMHNEIVKHVKLTKKIYGHSFYRDMMDQMKYHHGDWMNLPDFFIDSTIRYAIQESENAVNENMDHLVDYLHAFDMNPRVIWAMMGFSKEVLVSSLHKSLGLPELQQQKQKCLQSYHRKAADQVHSVHSKINSVPWTCRKYLFQPKKDVLAIHSWRKSAAS